jgi:hypothetical protein
MVTGTPMAVRETAQIGQIGTSPGSATPKSYCRA